MELTEVLDFLGAKDVKDLDALKAHVNKTFVTETSLAESEIGKKFSGKLFGEFNGGIRTLAKEYGIDFKDSEIKDLGWRERADLFAKKMLDTHNKVVEDLKANGGGATDEKIKAWEKKFADKVAELTQTNELLVAADKKAKELEASFAGKEKAMKLNNETDKMWGGFKWVAGTSEFAKKGFRADFESKFIFDFDDTGKFIAKTKEGAFVSNPKKAGEWLSPIEIMQQEGIAGKVWDDNPNGGDKVGGLGAWDFSNLKKDDGGGAKVQIHPSAAKAAGA